LNNSNSLKSSISMNLWLIHEVCKTRWKKKVTHRLRSDIIRISKLLFTIGCISIKEHAIIARFSLSPPRTPSIGESLSFCLKYSIYRPPSSWKEILKGYMTMISFRKFKSQSNLIELSFMKNMVLHECF
jgi:hypothetical protein